MDENKITKRELSTLETSLKNERGYDLKVIAKKIINILPKVRYGGIFYLENLIETEDNPVLKEGIKRISELKLEDPKEINDFVETEYEKYGITNNRSKIAMKIGLYSLSHGTNPIALEALYDFIENCDPDKIDMQKFLSYKE